MKVKEENKERFLGAMVNLFQAIKSETEARAKICGVVTEKELQVMAFLAQSKIVKMSDVADNIMVPMSTLTSIVDKLVERDLISRDHSSEDRRVINVSLSPGGRAAFNKVNDKQKRLSEVVLSNLNNEDQLKAIDLLYLMAKEINSSK